MLNIAYITSHIATVFNKLSFGSVCAGTFFIVGKQQYRTVEQPRSLTFVVNTWAINLFVIEIIYIFVDDWLYS